MVDKSKDAAPVGYSRPPMHSRFAPGKSGNPAGRPKQAPSFMNDLLGELGEEVPVAGQPGQTVTRQRALIRALVREAVAGNLRAVALLMPVLAGGAENEEENPTASAEDAEILDSYVARELKRRAQDETPAVPSPATTEEKK